jgi:hypothetical protein
VTTRPTVCQDHADDDRDFSYFRLDPTGKKPPKRITKRQFDRDKNFITFLPPQPERRP